MEKKFREWRVDQAWLLPPSVLEFVPEGHPAHFIRETVRESLDLSAILGRYDEVRGQPPFHPAMMVALLLYSYTQGIYSSRKIAAACENRVDFMAVTGMQKPAHRTICLFRKQHLESLAGLFKQVVRLCDRAGLVKLGHVALDGSKIRANASKYKGGNYKRLKNDEQRVSREVDEWFRRAGEFDDAEDREHGEEQHGDELPDWVKNRQKRLEKIREAKKSLEEEAKREVEEKQKTPPKYRGGRKSKTPPGEPKDSAQRNFTDPESRIMKSSDGFQQCYNAQIAVDSESQVIVSNHVTNAASDRRQLVPILRSIKENVGRQSREVSADGDYCSEENLKEISRRRIRGYVSAGRHYQSEERGRRTPPKPGTRARTMWQRIRRAGHRSRYRLRKQVVEPVFGQIKSARQFRQFLLRGQAKVTSEWSLICIAHNLLKLARA